MLRFYYIKIIQTQKAPLFENLRKARGPIFLRASSLQKAPLSRKITRSGHTVWKTPRFEIPLSLPPPAGIVEENPPAIRDPSRYTQ